MQLAPSNTMIVLLHPDYGKEYQLIEMSEFIIKSIFCSVIGLKFLLVDSRLSFFRPDFGDSEILI